MQNSVDFDLLDAIRCEYGDPRACVESGIIGRKCPDILDCLVFRGIEQLRTGKPGRRWRRLDLEKGLQQRDILTHEFLLVGATAFCGGKPSLGLLK
jgi:hypothetical protein